MEMGVSHIILKDDHSRIIPPNFGSKLLVLEELINVKLKLQTTTDAKW
jgi:hypothetical protein